jgi:hypothetical protein
MAEDLTAEDRPTDEHSQMGIYTAGDRPYLGDPKVVAKILRDMVDAMFEEIGASFNPDDPEDSEDFYSPDNRAAAVEGAIEDAVGVLTGEDDDYAPMGKWNTGDGLGNWIRGHMNGVPDGDTAEAVRYALAHLALHFMDGAKAISCGRETAEAVGPKLQRMMQNWTALMLGIPSGLTEEPTVQAPKA